MAKWTEAELAALDSVPDGSLASYHAWASQTNYSRDYNSFEVKRRRRGATKESVATDFGHAAPVEPVLVTSDERDSFVGFSVAYWDLETTFSTQPIVLFGAIADEFGRVQEFRKGSDITEDRDLVRAIRDRLNEYDIWVTWNGKLFDVPVLNGRLLFHGLEPLTPKMHIDAMYKASGSDARIGRRSLESVSKYFDVANKKTPLLPRIWDKAMAGDPAAYEKIAEHGHADVLVLRDVFAVLKPQVRTIQR